MADPRPLVQRQFAAHADKYVTSRDHVRGDSLDRLLELVQPQPNWRVLDVATGGGHTALAIAPHVREVVASDVTREMLAAAERHLSRQGVTNVVFREADAGALPFELGEFDLVTCRIAPHHFPDCAAFVREAARVVRPGGLVALIDNIVPDDPQAARFINALEKLRDPSHQWAHAQGAWLDFFALAGLRVTSAEVFQKSIDFEPWAERIGVGAHARLQLKVLLRHAPPAARQALAPVFQGEAVSFMLTELLLIAARD